MMTENSSSSFQLTSTTTTDSQNLRENHIALQDQQQVTIKGEYEYIENGTVIGHNSCNRVLSDNQEEQIANESETDHNVITNRNQYHIRGSNNLTCVNTGGNANTEGGGGGGGSSNGRGGDSGGGGGGGTLNSNTISHHNNSVQERQQSVSPTLQQQQQTQQQQQQQTSRAQQQAIVSTTAPVWHAPQNPGVQQQQSQIVQQQQQQQQQQHSASVEGYPANAFGVLSHANDILYITESPIVIGRNSSTSCVHFHVGKNSFVSRKHFQILFDQQTGDFYLICLSKNGVFVDDIFQRKSTEAMKLPKTCNFRFPSTDIRIAFESFSENKAAEVKTSNKAVTIPNVIYSPLKITIPKQEQKSPYPSPTGTISAANSCPTSPRQGLEYHSYNYNNNNNFQNDLFQPPSTSTYNEYEKPPYSYAQLIVQSISASPDKQLTLSGIYSFISKHYPYYRKEANKGWQNSIRHNLSLNRYFIKVARSQDEPGKGSFWRIDPNSEAKLIDQSYKKRRQRGSQCFRPSYGMPRSAPVSPSHIDNSRENSPIHDIVLQSAPGSPGVSYQNNHNESNHSGSEEVSNYSSQNLGQHTTYKYTNSSNYFHPSSNATSTIITTTGPIKRHQTSSGSGSVTASVHSDIYDEMGDYSGGGVDSDECENIKRQKYTTEINQ